MSYINKNGKFIIERVKQMNQYEDEVYNRIDNKEAFTLREIAERLEYTLDPSKKISTEDWNLKREKLLDL